VANFYLATMAALDEIGIRPRIYASPVELPDALAFELDGLHRSYDPGAARRFWLVLLQNPPCHVTISIAIHSPRQVLSTISGVLRISRRRDSREWTGAPPPRRSAKLPRLVQQEAYSHQLSRLRLLARGKW